MECSNSSCGALYCTYCLEQHFLESCKQCCNTEAEFRKPSRLIVKMLNQYVIKCEHCFTGFKYDQLHQHEQLCRNQWRVCRNPLCKNKFKDGHNLCCSQKCE